MVVAGLHRVSRGSRSLRPGQRRRADRAFSMEPRGAQARRRTMPDGELTLQRARTGLGFEVTQTLRIPADTYVVEQSITVENRHSVPQSAELALAVESAGGVAEGARREVPGTASDPDAFGWRRLAWTREDPCTAWRLPADQGANGSALESEWYLTALIPPGSGWQLIERKHERDQRPAGQARESSSRSAVRASRCPCSRQARPGRARSRSISGRRSTTRLKALGVGLEKSIYFGGFPLPQSYGGLADGVAGRARSLA